MSKTLLRASGTGGGLIRICFVTAGDVCKCERESSFSVIENEQGILEVCLQHSLKPLFNVLRFITFYRQNDRNYFCYFIVWIKTSLVRRIIIFVVQTLKVMVPKGPPIFTYSNSRAKCKLELLRGK